MRTRAGRKRDGSKAFSAANNGRPAAVCRRPTRKCAPLIPIDGRPRRAPTACFASHEMARTETTLQLARRHVADGSRLVAEQAERVARMDPAGDLVGPATGLLETMEATLEVFKSDLARLESQVC